MPNIRARLIEGKLSGDLKKKAQICFARQAIQIGGNNVVAIFKTTAEDTNGAWQGIHDRAISATIAHLGHSESIKRCKFTLEVV